VERTFTLRPDQRFAEDKIRVMGTIQNDWDPKKSNQYGYGYGYQYY
jgi:hypothetical protein